ncbi:TfoX/Sxy family protein [Halomonas denitrificans]|nr:TfoX/Sxy family protein [Halomonas denitrificans]
MRLRDLPGLGPASEAMLVEAGIDTPAALQRAGAVGAFLAVERSLGGTSLNLLYALVGAIEGRPWTAVAREDRERLLMELEDRREFERFVPGVEGEA